MSLTPGPQWGLGPYTLRNVVPPSGSSGSASDYTLHNREVLPMAVAYSPKRG